MNADKVRAKFLSLLPVSVYQTEDDRRTLEHWLDKPESTLGNVYHAAVKAAYDEGVRDGVARNAPSTCSSSGLTLDQLEELAQLKVDNEQLRTSNDLIRDEIKQLHIDLDKANQRVAALKALLDEHGIFYRKA